LNEVGTTIERQRRSSDFLGDALHREREIGEKKKESTEGATTEGPKMEKKSGSLYIIGIYFNFLIIHRHYVCI